MYAAGAERTKAKEESALKKIVRDGLKISREHLQGTMTQVGKNILFNGADAAASVRYCASQTTGRSRLRPDRAAKKNRSDGRRSDGGHELSAAF